MLNETQIQFLKSFGTYKPFALRDQWYRENEADYDTLVEELVALGFLKKNKAGAVTRNKAVYDQTGSYHGAEADANRKMWQDSATESAKAFNCKPYRGTTK